VVAAEFFVGVVLAVDVPQVSFREFGRFGFVF